LAQGRIKRLQTAPDFIKTINMIKFMNYPGRNVVCTLTIGWVLLIALASGAEGNPAPNSAPNQLVTSQLSRGKTMADAEPGELAMAVKGAVRANPKQASAIVGQVFSRFEVGDSRKALASIDAVASTVPASELPGVVRAAVSALPDRVEATTGLSVRSVLGQLIAKEASTLSPAQAHAIANAIWTLIWLANRGKEVDFHGPGDCDHPANHWNCGGHVYSPCSN
jgi:hypothetical protein